MNLSDYIIDFICRQKTDVAFVMTGSAIAELIDSFRHYSEKIKYVCVNHEQAAAMAAEAYSRTTGRIGVAIGTSGPGGTNLITGIAGAWYDCIPTLYIVGQVRSTELKGKLAILQRGFQEIDIVSLVKPITKYATQITDCDDIRYEMEKALHYATQGRPGPVLIDLPMDIQKANIDLSNLKRFHARSIPFPESVDLFNRSISMIRRSVRPLIIAGGGIRHAGAVKEFREFVDKTKIPVVFSYAGLDTLPYNHPSHVGILGQYGHAGANQLSQKADLIISLGSRFTKKMIGGNSDRFASKAKVISVNIDSDELKDGQKKLDLAVHADVKYFLAQLKGLEYETSEEWILEATKVKTRWKKLKKRGKLVNPYEFINYLSECMSDESIVIPDVGQNVVTTIQGIRLKEHQRIFSSWANSPMGYSLPASMGAKLGNSDKEVICIIGDGGIQVNLQELQTISANSIGVKIFLLNNNGYVTIQEFQDKELDGRYVASDFKHGYSHPNFKKLCSAFDIPYCLINTRKDFYKINEALETDGPILCEVSIEDNFRLTLPDPMPDT